MILVYFGVFIVQKSVAWTNKINSNKMYSFYFFFVSVSNKGSTQVDSSIRKRTLHNYFHNNCYFVVTRRLREI